MGCETAPLQFDPDKGRLYKLDIGKQLTTQVDKIGLSNGLAWLSDSSRLFYIDSLTYTVDVFDFDSRKGLPSMNGSMEVV